MAMGKNEEVVIPVKDLCEEPKVEAKPDPFKGRRGFRGPKRFSFTYEDMGRVLGLKPEYVRQLVCRGKLEPTLDGIVGWLWSKSRKDR